MNATATLTPLSGWLRLAACRGHDTSMWFSADTVDQAIAVAVCRTCPVRAECLAEALALERDAVGGLHGIRGGRTAQQREAKSRGSRTSS